jgi:hypothetical protein
MSKGEMMYLLLVCGGFAAFAISLAAGRFSYVRSKARQTAVRPARR